MFSAVRRVVPPLLSLSVPVAALTCREPAGPGLGPPGLTIVAGAGVADTIDTHPAQALIVEVRLVNGLPARGAVVRFAGLPIDNRPVSPTTVTVGPLDREPLLIACVDTVGADGRAEVLVALGPRAGPGGVEITVPVLGLRDTAVYTIYPGNAVTVVSEPADTALAVSRGFALRVSVRDRYGNVRADAITFAGDSAAATVSANGAVSGVTAGRARVRVGDAAGHADTSWVSVVPQGTIAAISPTGIAIVDLDGSNYRPVPGVGAAAWVDWNPRGDTLVFSSSDYDSWLFVSDLVAAPRRLITDSTGLLSEYRPQYSGDGQWIYFGGRPDIQNQAIWRVRPDGTSPVRVGPVIDPYNSDGQPAPTNDGLLVAYASNRCCYPVLGLFLLHVQSGVVDSLAPSALTPHWSPDDSLIGYVIQGQGIWVVRPDGSGLRQLTPVGVNYYQGFDWSPAGDWIIARGPNEHLQVIRVADGLVMDLPHFTNLDRPAWRP